jgi:hypothetical protein
MGEASGERSRGVGGTAHGARAGSADLQRNDRMPAICRGLLAVGALVAASVLGGLLLSRSSAVAATLRVTDAATGESLRGAVVAVVWYRAVFHGVAPYHVVEQVTDVEGRVTVMELPGIGLPPARRDVLVYKPGYRPRIERAREPRAPLFAQAEVGLTKVATLEEARRQGRAVEIGLDLCDGTVPLPCVRPDQVPHLMRRLAIHEEVYNPPPAGIIPSGQGSR